MVFWQAARAALSGNLALLADGARFTAVLNEEFAHWLTGPLPLHPWVYPPHFLLLLLPFGVPDFWASYGFFIVATFALAIVALLAFERGLRSRILFGALVLSPAAAITAIAGQNAFLSAALIVGGMRLAAARPVLGGAVLGVLTVKPQLFLMVPVALVAARQWRALSAAVVAAATLVAASAALFGAALWQQWFAAMLDPANEIHRGWTALSLMWGESVYTDAILLGANSFAAAAVQGAAILIASASVAHAYAKRRAGDLALAVLLAASVLAAPHVATYDTLFLAIAAGLFFAHALERGLRPFDLPLALALWLVPLYGAPIASPLGFAAPLVVLMFLARMLVQPP